ncbi:hypothetical protein HCH52_06785 [Oscillospiraceae bacterium HV4-5-C5C]|nr:hypothetical protein [Oscillospiraceae bacterium HV4-5-C5C]
MNPAVIFSVMNYSAIMAGSLLAAAIALIILSVSLSRLSVFLRQEGRTGNGTFKPVTNPSETAVMQSGAQAAAVNETAPGWSEEWVAVAAAAIACYESEQAAQTDLTPAPAPALPQSDWQAPTTAGFRIKPRRRVSL